MSLTAINSPQPEWPFKGLCAGDQWCLCAARWLEAHEAGIAPRVMLASTHEAALEIIPIELLKQYAVVIN